jgi:hypothetical protein
MEEHVKTEQDLSEEQLQVITGGCDQCTTDWHNVGEHHYFADYNHKAADAMRNLAQQSQTTESRQRFEKVAAYHTNLAGGHIQMAQTLIDGINARGQHP